MSKTKTMSKGTAKAIVAVCLSAAMLVGGGVVGYGMATDWTYQKASNQIAQTDNQNAGNAVVNPSEENGIKVMSTRIAPADFAANGVSTFADSAYTLTATITPANTTYKAVDYTAAWANPQSEWAKSKDISDYVTVAQSVDGSLSATLTILQPFSEQIQIKVTLRRNAEINATCTVDYVGCVGATIANNGNVNDVDDFIQINLSGLKYGTLSPDLNNLLTVEIEVYGITGLNSKGYTVSDTVEYTISADSITDTVDVATVRNVFYKAAGLENAEAAEKEAYWVALSGEMLRTSTPDEANGNAIFNMRVYSNRKYGDNSYTSEKVIEYEISFYGFECFEVPATGMDISNTTIVTG